MGPGGAYLNADLTSDKGQHIGRIFHIYAGFGVRERLR